MIIGLILYEVNGENQRKMYEFWKIEQIINEKFFSIRSNDAISSITERGVLQENLTLKIFEKINQMDRMRKFVRIQMIIVVEL